MDERDSSVMAIAIGASGMDSAKRSWPLTPLPRLFLAIVVISAFPATFSRRPAYGQISSSSLSLRQTAKISSVRKVLHGASLCTTRYSRIHDFDVYLSLRTGQEIYCVDYETPVLDEIRDLVSSEGKDVDINLDAKRNKIILYTLHSGRLKARIVRGNLCQSPRVSSRALR